MNATSMAQRAYAPSSASIRTPRGTEYEVIARVTHRLKSAAENGTGNFAALAESLHENRTLWTALAVDVADENNALPTELKARIFYLAEFTNHHTSKVLANEATVEPLLEINTAILRGLQQKAVLS